MRTVVNGLKVCCKLAETRPRGTNKTRPKLDRNRGLQISTDAWRPVNVPRSISDLDIGATTTRTSELMCNKTFHLIWDNCFALGVKPETPSIPTIPVGRLRPMRCAAE